MQLDNLTMPTFSTTLVGVLKGTLDHYGVKMSAPMTFGLSGHAFLMNVHKKICPSGPYCWDGTEFNRLLKNMGLERRDLGFFSWDSPAEEKSSVEQKLKSALDEGVPCSMCNLDNQIIIGYDESGLLAAEPWGPKMDSTPGKLSFGTWKEFGKECHVNFYTLRKMDSADLKTAIADSLDYAANLYGNPSQYDSEDYGIGPAAYANWKNALSEYGSGHGNWWNGTVWSECRKMASEYFTEIAEMYDDVSDAASALSDTYAEISAYLDKVKDKKTDVADKLDPLEKAEAKEKEAIEAVAALAGALRGRAGS